MAASGTIVRLQSAYIFDANAFIDMGEDLYPPDVFRPLWDLFEAALDQGQIVTCKRVLAELSRPKTNDAWRKLVHTKCAPRAIDESDIAIQTVFARLSGLVANGNLSRGLTDVDLLVLSCAEAQGLGVVTRDTKMINACKNGHVAANASGLTAVFRTLGWSL